MMPESRCSASQYKVVPHAQLGDLATQIYELARLAFGTYPGVLLPSEAHRRWYVQRPGMDRLLSRAVVRDGQLVSNLFVTVTRMRLGGVLQRVGVLDTVMTHPDHRRQGLARRLLAGALDGMRSRGLDAALLYTVRDSMPYHFYRSLGFRSHAPVHYLQRTSPSDRGQNSSVRLAMPREHGAVRRFLNDYHVRHDGYVPIDESLWQWRKVNRPPELPALVYLAETSKQVVGSVTVCRAPIVTEQGASDSYTVTDLALAESSDTDDLLHALLGVVRPGACIRILSADTDRPVYSSLIAAGFARSATEVAMIRPFSESGQRALSRSPAPWYVLAESVIGL